MEKKTGLSLYSSTTIRSCIVDGYKLFATNFISLLKSSWLSAVLFGICCSIIGLIEVIYLPRAIASEVINGMSAQQVIANHQDICILFVVALVIGGIIEIWLYSHSVSQIRSFATNATVAKPTKWFSFDKKATWKTFKAFFFLLIIAFIAMMAVSICTMIMSSISGTTMESAPTTTKVFIAIITIIICLLLLPLAATTMGYLIHDDLGFFKRVLKRYRVATKHYSQLFSVVLGGVIITIAIMSLLTLPVIILATANMQANMGNANGDPLNMPSYMPILTGLIFFMFGILKSYLNMSFLYPVAFVSGQIEKREMERREADLQAGINTNGENNSNNCMSTNN